VTGRDFLNDTADLVEQYRASILADFEAIPEEKIWERPIPGQVSSANMMLHLIGNIRHFFGHLLDGSDYERNRDREFLDEPYATKAEIIEAWQKACEETKSVLSGLDEKKLATDAPVNRFPGGAPVRMFVLRLLAHLAYHAGQIRTHYRVLVEVES
jgi:uncharacterized damage-inducible protein DinB